jgi:hypothetical protein
MANNLVSPGVQVTVIDESNYAPTAVGTTPFIIMATAQDKTNNSGTLATGTTKANAGKIFNIGDQRSLVSQFGMPTFPTDASGNRIYGSELAEYGLHAAYNVLDTISSAYVMRADINLDELAAAQVRPTQSAPGGVLWLDSAITSWGVFQWDAASQQFARKTPVFLTTDTNLVMNEPKPSFGNVGDYAIVGTLVTNPLYYKDWTGTWQLVGSSNWKTSVPTIQAANANVTSITPGNKININGVEITAGAATDIALANVINTTTELTSNGVRAEIVSNKLTLFADDTAMSNGMDVDGMISIADVSTYHMLTALGIQEGTYSNPEVQFSKHSNVPAWKTAQSNTRPSGSIWIKTTNFNYGANIATYRRNAVTSSWDLIPCLLFADDADALYNLDPTRGGLNIAPNTLYCQYGVDQDGSVTYQVKTRTSSGATKVVGDMSNPTLTAADSFDIQVSITGSNTLTMPMTIVVGASINGTPTAATVAGVQQLISYNNIPNITAGVDSAGHLTLTHATGGVIALTENHNSPLADMGISGNEVAGTMYFSNWAAPDTILQQNSEPTAIPNDGTLWFYSGVTEADILINVNNSWMGYQNVDSAIKDVRGYDLSVTDPMGPIFSYTKPTMQSDGSPLAHGDLWIDTSDMENYPVICRWEVVNATDTWVQIDTKDSTTTEGIVFADARWDTDGTSDIFLNDIVPITDLLVSDYVDLDCPNPDLYPNGCLLFNTRRSSNNIKKYIRNYFNVNDFPQMQMPIATDTWQTASGKKWNNVPYFGRQAQRNVIVSAMEQAVTNSAELREEGKNFNLLVAPGYTELLGTLKNLNDDRRNTGFIIGEVPMGLSTDQTTVEKYLTDATTAGITTEDGLVNHDSYTAVFYPGAATMSALTGTGSIVVPTSTVMLKTIVRSDQLSDVWFAPAGNARGVLDCLSIGYVNRSNRNSFTSTGTPQGLRDLLYTHSVNPLVYFPQVGLINYGNHTRQTDATALDRINVARLVAYLRGRLEQIVRPLVFEPNDKITRDKAKAIVDQLLNDVATRRGVYDFLVVCDRSNNTNATIDRNELHIDIAIEPVKSVEFIYIPVRIKATGQIKGGNIAPALPLA